MFSGMKKTLAVPAPVELPTDLATAIEEARHRRHLTQTDFAREVGVTLHTVRRWLDGAAPPRSPAIRLRLREALGLRLSSVAAFQRQVGMLDGLLGELRQ